MNPYHRWYCGSARWERRVRANVAGWALAGVALGDDPLEIGPGPGKVTALLSERAPRLTCIEIDRPLARALSRRMEGTDVEVIEGDACAMPFEDGRFSAAVSLFMLHHVPSEAQQDALFAETFRVLRPGGLFAGADSRPSWAWRAAHLFDDCCPLDPGGLVSRLEHAGFVDVRVNATQDAFRFRACRPCG